MWKVNCLCQDHKDLDESFKIIIKILIINDKNVLRSSDDSSSQLYILFNAYCCIFSLAKDMITFIPDDLCQMLKKLFCN